jgi:NAD(P)-dependent dehydrogenase (short-subunit alcohol dehydrogenase family)
VRSPTRWDPAAIPELTGSTAVVTGATSGLGRASAAALAARGCRVLLACRASQRAEAALRSVAACAAGPPPELLIVDLADLGSVGAAADLAARRVDGLDLLINNAGVMALPPMLTADGVELQFGTNHLGHFALTAGLWPLLERRPASRVVTVSSVAARVGSLQLADLERGDRYEPGPGYDPWRAYACSKQANLLFALELHRRSRRSRTDGPASLAAHPGWAATDLVDNGPGRFAGPASRAVYTLTRLLAVSPDAGALPQLRAATDRALPSGSYVGPGGPLGLWGRPVPVRVPRCARDRHLASALWDASERMAGVSLLPDRR